MSIEDLKLKRFNDLFLSNLMLLLNLGNSTKSNNENFKKYLLECNLAENIVLLINNYNIPRKRDTSKSEKEYKLELYKLSEEHFNLNNTNTINKTTDFLNSILNNKLSTDGLSNIIQKVFFVLKDNLELLKTKNPKLFQLKLEDKRTKTIIPGIDLIYIWYGLTNTEKLNMWFYLKNLYLTSNNMIELINNNKTSNYNELDYKKLKKDYLESFPNTTIIDITNLDIDLYSGVGSNDTNSSLSIKDIFNNIEELNKNDSNATNTNNTNNPINASNIIKMMGINMDELKDKLKNIDKSELEEATKNIKQLLGDNIDKETADTITDIMTDITDQLKNEDLGDDPIENLAKVAENVANKNKNKIDPKKLNLNKLIENTEKLMNNDPSNKNNIFSGANNPLNLLKKMVNTNKPMNEREQKKMMNELMKNMKNMKK